MYGSAAQVRGRSKHLGHVGTAQAAGRAHGAALHGRDGGALAPAAIHVCKSDFFFFFSGGQFAVSIVVIIAIQPGFWTALVL